MAKQFEMAVEKVFIVLLMFLIVFTPTFQNGINFYKALNRTPANRVERYNRDGFNNKALKIPLPLTKRLLYDGLMDSAEKPDELDQKNEEESLSILLNWFPPNVKPNDPKSDDASKKCMDIRDLLSRMNN